MSSYSKLIVDGKCIKVWKGAPTKDTLRKQRLIGIHIEIANKNEFIAFNGEKNNQNQFEQLKLWGQRG